MTRPPPEPRPLVYVKDAWIEGRTSTRITKRWILVLFCGHRTTRKSETEPQRVRCDECWALQQAREAAE